MLNVFAAEMALGISEDNINACLKRIEGGEEIEGGEVNKVTLLFTVVTALCIEYIKDTGLKKSDDLYKRIVGNLANLATVLSLASGCNHCYDYAEMSQCIAKGMIPIPGNKGKKAEGETDNDSVDIDL